MVTAAELLSLAAFKEGRHAQAFPSFGSERTGAPVVSFCRIDEHPIRTREPVSAPDALVIQDPTLLHQVDVVGGLGSDGYVLINSPHTFTQMGLEEWVGDFKAERVLTVAASDICRAGQPRLRPNAALLGGLAALTSVVSLSAVTAAIDARFAGSLAADNAAAARACFEHVLAEIESGVTVDA